MNRYSGRMITMQILQLRRKMKTLEAGFMTKRENYLRAVRFERPDHIPMTFAINAACWHAYPHEALFELQASHPLLFPDFSRPSGDFKPYIHPVARKGVPYTDDFGCVWETMEDGITGTVTGHPLAEWSSFASCRFPDPEVCTGIGPIDWMKTNTEIAAARACGELTWGGLRHGHTFLQLCDLRGYQNLMFDMADDEPNLHILLEKLEAFNLHTVNRYLDAGVDVIGYGEDLGMQKGPMVSPAFFREFIKPSYQRLMKPARDKGTIVHMHSDGDLHDLIEDLIDGGVEVINLQDLVNGVEWIANRFAGKVCVDLDIDRQVVTPYGTPDEIDDLIRSEVEAIGRKEGGLTMIYGLYPGVPLENVKALMDAMEKYAFLFS